MGRGANRDINLLSEEIAGSASDKGFMGATRSFVELHIPLSLFPDPCPDTPAAYQELFRNWRQEVDGETWSLSHYSMEADSFDEEEELTSPDMITSIYGESIVDPAYINIYTGIRLAKPRQLDDSGKHIGGMPKVVVEQFAQQQQWFDRFLSGASQYEDEAIELLNILISDAKGKYPRKEPGRDEVVMTLAIKPAYAKSFTENLDALLKEAPGIEFKILS